MLLKKYFSIFGADYARYLREVCMPSMGYSPQSCAALMTKIEEGKDQPLVAAFKVDTFQFMLCFTAVTLASLTFCLLWGRSSSGVSNQSDR